MAAADDELAAAGRRRAEHLEAARGELATIERLVIERYRAGERKSDLARRAQISRPTVDAILDRSGVQRVEDEASEDDAGEEPLGEPAGPEPPAVRQ